jgi:hypothetical protein
MLLLEEAHPPLLALLEVANRDRTQMAKKLESDETRRKTGQADIASTSEKPQSYIVPTLDGSWIKFGRLATDASICEVFQHSLFGYDLNWRGYKGAGGRDIADPSHLMAQWLRQQSEARGLSEVDLSYNLAPKERLFRIADRNFTACLQRLEKEDPQRLVIIATYFLPSLSGAAHFGHANIGKIECIHPQVEERSSISREGQIERSQVIVGKTPCLDFGKADLMENPEKQLLIMLLVEEAHTALKSILDDADGLRRDIAGSPEREKLSHEAEQQTQLDLPNGYLIRSRGRKLRFGTIASDESICSVLRKSLFEHDPDWRGYRDADGGAILDPKGLMAQWLRNRGEKLGLNEADLSTGLFPKDQVLRIADENFAKCLQSLEKDTPQTLTVIATHILPQLSESKHFGHANIRRIECVHPQTHLNPSISPEGKIREDVFVEEKLCLRFWKGDLMAQRDLQFLVMLLIEEAHPAILSILEDSDRVCIEAAENAAVNEQLNLAAKARAAKEAETQQKVEELRRQAEASKEAELRRAVEKQLREIYMDYSGVKRCHAARKGYERVYITEDQFSLANNAVKVKVQALAKQFIKLDVDKLWLDITKDEDKMATDLYPNPYPSATYLEHFEYTCKMALDGTLKEDNIYLPPGLQKDF